VKYCVHSDPIQAGSVSSTITPKGFFDHDEWNHHH
jgi:hypothetical protein